MDRPAPDEEYHHGNIENYEPFCGPYSLAMNTSFDDSHLAHRDVRRSSCSLPSVSRHACSNIFKHFYQSSSVRGCPSKKAADFCKVANGRRGLAVRCNFSQCRRKRQIQVGVLDAYSGILKWHRFFHNGVSDSDILDLMKSTLLNKNPFMFIECHQDSDGELLTQFIVVPPHSDFTMKRTAYPRHAINMNLILIDSVSREHFYRMLPNTIRYLQRLDSSKDVDVLDFELFHSLKGRTFENLKALFEGKVEKIEEKFEADSVPPTPVNFDVLLRRFKKFRYNVLYQEDLCWEYDWGLIKDSGVYRSKLPKDARFPALMRAISKHGIDSLGVTHSTCEFFHRFGIIDHFNYHGRLCFSGNFIHDYFLQHLRERLTANNMSPLLSFLLMNVGHEGTGRRIRTFDESLFNFLSSTTSSNLTIHILFSDHGNSYGPFSSTGEGQVETFHPFMFMILPRTVSKLLGKEKMRNLKHNQKKLVTLLDLHFTLLELLDISMQPAMEHDPVVPRRGLFHPISSSRSCDDLQLHRSTLCFCEGWKTSLPTSSSHFLIAEFILAKLNNKIYKMQQRKGNESRSCQRLIGTTVFNAWQKTDSDKLHIGLDVKVQYGNVFSAIISCSLDSMYLFDMKIIAIHRRSSFGVYKVCADGDVPLHLCICSKRHSDRDAFRKPPGTSTASMFSVQTDSRVLHSNCLFILIRQYKAGAVFEASNACWNITYSVKLDFELENMKLATPNYQKHVPPSSVVSLAVAIMDMPGIRWYYRYNASVSWKRLD